MNALLAFIHHLAAFALVAALTIELILIREELTASNVRKLQTADLIFGIAAGVILIAGLCRVMYFEKGTAYYLQSIPFLVKFSLFAIIGLLSIYPTVKFLSWSKQVKQGHKPVVKEQTLRLMRRLIHIELAGMVVLILCAVLMARGVGVIG